MASSRGHLLAVCMLLGLLAAATAGEFYGRNASGNYYLACVTAGATSAASQPLPTSRHPCGRQRVQQSWRGAWWPSCALRRE
jgi:hypothetical protein